MWICLNDAFLSIVDDNKKPGCLLVRARRKGDIEKVFPDADVKTLRGRDYQFRDYIYRDVVVEAISKKVLGIDYPNFKGSVDDWQLENAYHRMWDVHATLQPKEPYRM